MNWLTNDLHAATYLHNADAAYGASKKKASTLQLAKKVEALRKAKQEKQAAYKQAMGAA